MKVYVVMLNEWWDDNEGGTNNGSEISAIFDSEQKALAYISDNHALTSEGVYSGSSFGFYVHEVK